jgi:hypothetical protein
VSTQPISDERFHVSDAWAERIVSGEYGGATWGEIKAACADLLEARAALVAVRAERDAAIERLHRCRADYHAKVIALQKKRSVYRGGEPPDDLPDDWVGEAAVSSPGETPNA